MILNNLDAYLKYAKEVNPRIINFFDVEFKNRAKVTTLQSFNEKGYTGDIYEAPITAPEITPVENINFDLDAPYAIKCDNEANILSFSYFNKGEDRPVMLYGEEARTPFIMFVGAMRNKRNVGKVSDLSGKSR